jgi:hypothetical protein
VNPLRVPVSVPARSVPEDNLADGIGSELHIMYCWVDVQCVGDTGSPKQRATRRSLGGSGGDVGLPVTSEGGGGNLSDLALDWRRW